MVTPGVALMRLVHLVVATCGLAVAGCAAAPPVSIVQQRSDASCTTNVVEAGVTAACKKPRRLAATSAVARAAELRVPAFEDSTSSLSSGVPILDVDPVCQGIAQQGGASFQASDTSKEKKRCLDDEAAVHRKLGETWQSFDVSDRTHCTTELKAGGQSSYSELITCLEMRQAVREAHEQLEAARHAQTIGQR